MSRIQFTVPVVVEPIEPEAGETEVKIRRLMAEVQDCHHLVGKIDGMWNASDKAKHARKLASKALALALYFEKRQNR